jgi:virginiamycin A acetyltransferase
MERLKDVHQMSLVNYNPILMKKRIENFEENGSKILAKLGAKFCRIQPLRSRILDLICLIEGGQVWSKTYRDVMKDWYGIEIGRYSYGSSIWPGKIPQGTKVKNYCSLAEGIKIFRRNHPTRFLSQHPFFFNSRLGILATDAIDPVEHNPLQIMDDAWIGSNVIITPHCNRIGTGAVVAAGSVVTVDVPDFTIVAGNPSRIIRKRFKEDICEVLLNSQWWKFGLTQLLSIFSVFVKDATLENALTLKEYLSTKTPQ